MKKGSMKFGNLTEMNFEYFYFFKYTVRLAAISPNVVGQTRIAKTSDRPDVVGLTIYIHL